MTIFDMITSAEITAYWELMNQNEAPYDGEELFPDEQQTGLEISWIKGARGVPLVLKPSAYDVRAIPRKRIGFEKLTAEVPYFKESKYIDETMRQELNKVLATGIQAYIDIVTTKIFDDELDLLRGARAQRERMRMMALTTGVIAIEGNGQVYEYDYYVPEEHKAEVTKSWSDPTASILDDIRTAQDKVEEDTGVRPTRAMCNSSIMKYLRANNEIKNSIAILTDGEGFISDSKIMQFIVDELGLTIKVNTKTYKDEDETVQKFVEDDVFVLYPEGTLGSTVFGITPEQSDLLTANVANVSITDTGVAVTTIKHADPVTVETKVSMCCLPSFPMADQIFIYDTKKGS